jgi:peptidyl-prolyl cis-trans isomerase SurA
MRRLPLLVAMMLAAVIALAQKEPIVMTVNGVPVTRSEFEYSYNKNKGDGAADKLTVEEYAELFVNYKLKVAAALDAKLDTLSSFKEEYAMYRNQQVRPTLVTDADVLEEAKRIYINTKEMIGPRGLIRPAHILIRLSTKASAREQEMASLRADSVYRALLAGADFAEMAGKVSQDPGSARQGGLLPWIAPNQTFKEFEDVAYSLQKGEMSRPFLSPAGYHIVLMRDRKQLEPFDSLKEEIVYAIEQQDIRDAIATQKVAQTVRDSKGTLTEAQLMDVRADSLAAVDSDMKYLMQEYHDGLLLYEISNQKVWKRAAEDEEGLRTWFRTHKKDYAWREPRYKGMAYHVKTKSDVKAVKRCVKDLPFEQWEEALRQTFNPDSVIRIRVEKGIFKPGDNPVVDKMVFKVRSHSQEVYSDYPIDAVYGKKLKKYPDDYTDVREKVVEDYQDMLESEWVASLRRHYPVQIDYEVLKTINQHP